MRGKLTKITDNENELRTRSISGMAPRLPEIGSSFVIIDEGGALEGEAKEVGGDRMVTTSIVQEITDVDGAFILRTLNSVYRLELDDELDKKS